MVNNIAPKPGYWHHLESSISCYVHATWEVVLSSELFQDDMKTGSAKNGVLFSNIRLRQPHNHLHIINTSSTVEWKSLFSGFSECLHGHAWYFPVQFHFPFLQNSPFSKWDFKKINTFTLEYSQVFWVYKS